MPDGDILRLGMTGHFGNAYQQLCEGIPSSKLAKQIAKSLCNRINWYGPGPRQLLKTMARHLENIIGQCTPISNENLVQIDKLINRERRQLQGKVEGFNVAIDAIHSFLAMLDNGEVLATPGAAMAHLFIVNALTAAFDARIISMPRHYDNAPATVVQERRNEVSNDLARYVDSLAKQIEKQSSSKKLRLPPTRIPRREPKLADEIE